MPDRTCEASGCERTHLARGMCRMHYLRAHRRGLEPLPSPSDRLAANLSWSDTGCHEWRGSVDESGYGRISVDGKKTGTHRLAYLLAHGEIPDGVEVCHTCDNPPCCNPDHLFLASHRENMLDMSSKGRGPGQSKTHCKNGHPFTPDNTSIRTSGDARPFRNCRTCQRDASARHRRKTA